MVDNQPYNPNLPKPIKKKNGLWYELRIFWKLNWRIIILTLLLVASILFIWWSNSTVDDNFTNTFR